MMSVLEYAEDVERSVDEILRKAQELGIDVSDKESMYPSVNVTDENALIAQEAAFLATKDMYHCHNPEALPSQNSTDKENRNGA